MDFTLKCLTFVTLTSASAFNDIYQSRYLEEPPPDIPNERQRMNERSIAVNSGVQRVPVLEIERLQTRDEAFPRTENGSYYNIVNVNPKLYPVIASRRGEVSYYEVEIPDLVPSYQRYVPDIPENCKNLGICGQINNYPHDVVNRIYEKLGEQLKNRLNVDILEQPKIVQKQGFGENYIELCNVNETVVFPQAAQTETGEWYVILNPEGVKLQGFRVQMCLANKTCATLIEFLDGYTGRCKQKYIQRAMAAVDVDKREIIYDKSFRVPSCCSCVATHHDET